MFRLIKNVWGRVGVIVSTGVLAVAVVVGYMQVASAAIDLTDFSLSLTTIEILVPILLTGGAAMWVVRKLIKSTNRS
ncbi:MAG: hypothetical protein A2099_07990 [Planctomycetes bacterium GWF2_39_10]|nr:MAG: hypothetical protein A2Y09_11335 [Planctomycetes bacterium GWA2_39_15]OHB46206.1 MAG: hypothetical protein A2099_07990 [Planctomycetes bacterium GWF2_39_10]